jgi:hypothetical protein
MTEVEQHGVSRRQATTHEVPRSSSQPLMATARAWSDAAAAAIASSPNFGRVGSRPRSSPEAATSTRRSLAPRRHPAATWNPRLADEMVVRNRGLEQMPGPAPWSLAPPRQAETGAPPSTCIGFGQPASPASLARFEPSGWHVIELASQRPVGASQRQAHEQRVSAAGRRWRWRARHGR